MVVHTRTLYIGFLVHTPILTRYLQCMSIMLTIRSTKPMLLPGFSVTAPWAFNWFLDGNENKVDISIVGTNGNFFLINAHGVLRRMGAVTEIPGTWQ